MRVTMIAIGSRGDVQPLVALGVGLQARGSTVRIATHPTFSTLVRNHGLEFAPVADGQSLVESVGTNQTMGEKRYSPRYLRKLGDLLAPHVYLWIKDCYEACADAEVIIASQVGVIPAYHVAEKRGLPLVRAFYFPTSPSRAYAASFVPARLHPGERLSLWTHHLSREFWWLLLRAPQNRARREVLNLEPLSWRDPFWRLERERSLLLYGFSPQIFPRPSDWGNWIHVTGHWFLDRPASWQPPRDLVDFLQSGPPPIYVSFGSMSTNSPGETVEIVIEALRRTGQRGVVQAGWGGLERRTSSDDIYAVDDIPYDWLLPQMAAVVHHGGAGTTHAALHAGVPNVVVPFIWDQRFWAQRLHDIGVGPRPIPPRQLSVDVLTERIRSATVDVTMQDRARAIGEHVRGEDGVKRAVEIFTSAFESGSRQAAAGSNRVR